MARPRDINGEPIIDPEEEAEKKKKAAERPKRKPKKAPTTKGRARKLTPRQEKFVSLIVKGKSQHDAYVAAYKTEGWTNERINQEASKVLHRQNVFSRYQELMKKALDKADLETADIGAFVIDSYLRIARANIINFFDVSIVTDDAGKRSVIYELKDNLEDVDTYAIQELSFTDKGRPRIKMYNRMDALKALENIYHVTAGENQQTADEVKFDAGMEDYMV